MTAPASHLKPKRMAWTKARIKVLGQLVADAPAIRPSDLAKQLNAVMRCKVTGKMVAEACSYYGIPRLRESELPKPQPWSDEEMVALRDWFSTVSLRSVSLDQVTRRMREITGRDVSLTELPDSLLRRVFYLRIFLLRHNIGPAGPGSVPLQTQRELAARRAMVSWLDPDQLVKAIGPIVKEAVTWCSRPPGQEDPQELEAYDPEHPESWWDAEVFLENVLRGFEEELRRQFDEAGAVAWGDDRSGDVTEVGEGAAARAPDATGSISDPLGELSGSLFDPLPSESTTDTHAIKPVGLQQDRPVISAGS